MDSPEASGVRTFGVLERVLPKDRGGSGTALPQPERIKIRVRKNRTRKFREVWKYDCKKYVFKVK